MNTIAHLEMQVVVEAVHIRFLTTCTPYPTPPSFLSLCAQVELNGEDIVFKLDEHLTSVSAITDGFETFDAELSEVRAATLDLLVSFAFKCLRAILFRSSLF